MSVLKGVRCIFWLLYMITIVRLGDSTSIKIIDEPFSIYHTGSQSNNVAPLEQQINIRVKPRKLSGPPHLFALEGKCYILNKASYKYELCPFHNVTQRELTYRWNAFHGALGVWKEWEIVGNQFNSMLMTDGESCIGPLSRQVNVFLKCGDDEKFVDIDEPRLCHYNLTFETPLACPDDAFLVYPVLSQNGKVQWQTLEEGLRESELTNKGYEKKRKELFLQEGLKVDEAEELERSKEANDDSTLKEHSNEKMSFDDYRLFSRTDCIQKYGELLKEVDRLRQQLKTLETNRTHVLPSESKAVLNKKDIRKYDAENTTSTLSGDLMKKEKNNAIKGSYMDVGKGASVESVGPRHPRDLRKGRKGDDGTNIKSKLQENSVLKSLGHLMGRMGRMVTSRKMVNLTEEERAKRDKEIAEKHMESHRVH